MEKSDDFHMMGDSEEEEDWQTDSGDDVIEDEAAKCLFSNDVLPSVPAALERDAVHFGFNLDHYVKEVSKQYPLTFR